MHKRRSEEVVPPDRIRFYAVIDSLVIFAGVDLHGISSHIHEFEPPKLRLLR